MFRSCIQQGLPFSACKLWWEFFSYQGSSCYLAAHRVIFLFLILACKCSFPWLTCCFCFKFNDWTMIDHLILVLFLMFLSHWFLQTLYQILQHLYHRYLSCQQKTQCLNHHIIFMRRIQVAIVKLVPLIHNGAMQWGHEFELFCQMARGIYALDRLITTSFTTYWSIKSNKSLID
jgi:hypothetical protein